MIRCVSCGFEDHSNPSIRMNMCDSCSIPKESGLPHYHQTRMLSTGDSIHVAWEKETEKRTIVPINKEGGGHYVGVWEGGKIREKKPVTI